MSAKYEDKFIVINRKYLRNKKAGDIDYIINALRILEMPDNKYYICNQDEPYASKVIKIILDGEFEKKKIQVCSECLRACCWYGEFMCGENQNADLIIKTVGELREIKAGEYERYWSDEHMVEIYGDPNPF